MQKTTAVIPDCLTKANSRLRSASKRTVHKILYKSFNENQYELSYSIGTVLPNPNKLLSFVLVW